MNRQKFKIKIKLFLFLLYLPLSAFSQGKNQPYLNGIADTRVSNCSPTALLLSQPMAIGRLEGNLIY